MVKEPDWASLGEIAGPHLRGFRCQRALHFLSVSLPPSLRASCSGVSRSLYLGSVTFFLWLFSLWLFFEVCFEMTRS